MKAPKTLIPLVLFVMAFAGSLFVLRRPESPGAAGSLPATASQGELRSLAGAVDDARPGEPAPSSASPDSQTQPESLTARDAQTSSTDVGQALDALSFGAPDDRVRAIQSLAATDPDAPELARVRSSLRLAAADEDPDIAARAQDAYDSLMKREDP